MKFSHSSRAICLHNLNELDDAQLDPIALQKLLNPEKVSDLISRVKYKTHIFIFSSFFIFDLSLDSYYY